MPHQWYVQRVGFVVILFGPDPALDEMNMCPSRNKSRRYLFLKMKKKMI